MNRLYDEKKETVETYTYKINNCGISEPGCYGTVIITFVNGYFSHAEYPFIKSYTEAQWEVLEAISQKIKEILREGI